MIFRYATCQIYDGSIRSNICIYLYFKVQLNLLTEWFDLNRIIRGRLSKKSINFFSGGVSWPYGIQMLKLYII